jgi:hypothetical protein
LGAIRKDGGDRILAKLDRVYLLLVDHYTSTFKIIEYSSSRGDSTLFDFFILIM